METGEVSVGNGVVGVGGMVEEEASAGVGIEFARGGNFLLELEGGEGGAGLRADDAVERTGRDAELEQGKLGFESVLDGAGKSIGIGRGCGSDGRRGFADNIGLGWRSGRCGNGFAVEGIAKMPPEPGEKDDERESEEAGKKAAGPAAGGGEFVFGAAHGSSSELEEDAELVDESVGVFGAPGFDDGGFSIGGDDALRLHLALGKKFAELAEEVGIFLEAFGEDGFADLHHLAVGVGKDGGAAAFAGEERHFAEAIAAAQAGDVRGRTVAFDDHVGFAGDEDEHRIAVVALLDDFFIAAEVDDAAAGQE